MQTAKTSTTRRIRDSIRQFNKKIYNPLIMKFAGRRLYAVVHHIGRRSGKRYATPVVAEQTTHGFVIPLPYGSDADWCRNVFDAGRCTIQYRDMAYQLEEPEVVEAKMALPTFPVGIQLSFRVFGIKQFLQMRHVSNT